MQDIRGHKEINMCVVSMMTPTLPGGGLTPQRPWNTQPGTFGWPPLQTLDANTLQTLQDILKRLDELDKKVGAKECKDEQKEAFFNELQALIDKYRAEEKE